MDRPAPSLLPTPSWASATRGPPRWELGELGTPSFSGREEQIKPRCSTKGKLPKCRISFWWNFSSDLLRGRLTIPWGSLLWPCSEDHSARGPLCRASPLQGLSAPARVSLLRGLSAPGPLCSRASALALSLLYLAAPICPSPSLVPLTKWTQSLPPLLADEKVRSYLLRTKLGVILKAIPSSWDTDFWWGITVYKNEFTQVDNVRTDLFQASFVNQRAGTRELEEVD